MSYSGRWRLDFQSPRRRRYFVVAWPYIPVHHVHRLLDWAVEHRRMFPWRLPASPFAVLVGEMLLRKTSARHALGVYEHLMDRFPTPTHLAQADPQALRQLLQPLGMVKHRVAGLLAMATFLNERYGGEVPSDPTELARIPHVGAYTANAVACFAFGLPLPLVDTNFVRVFNRFTGRTVFGDKARAHTRPESWRRVTRSLPESQRVGDFHYAILDLAAQICRPRPKCTLCPLNRGCAMATRAQVHTGNPT